MSGPAKKPQEASHSNFIRSAIEADLASGKYAARAWGGKPGPAKSHEGAPPDPAMIRTRFPPEPNGYLHIGHAKSICLNFGLARDYTGACHLRFDDTNPEKEEQEYVDSIIGAVKWLGFDWGPHLYYASDYFDFMYHAAECLIEHGHAYVDSLSAEQMRTLRGSLTDPGKESPYRSRSVEENLKLFRQMRDGRFKEGEHVLRAKIDMASPNINLRDPAIYRIRKATHHRTGDKWCFYPMYTYAHPIEDALERITHSLCTLEFEDQRPFYDWLLENLAALGLLERPCPRQYEFGRLNLSYVITSKRKLKALVDEKIVEGWDDPRMPTIFGMRRRGYTPEAIRAMADGSGASKTNIWLDYSVLDICLRDDLEAKAARVMAVLDPVELRLVNWTEVFGAGHIEPCQAPAHPHRPDLGTRRFGLGPRLWLEREDFAEVPPKGFFRLFPGNRVRLKYGIVVECTGCEKDAAGNVSTVLAKVVPDTKSGTPGADAVKVKGTITWVGVEDAIGATVNLFERLFTEAQPDAAGRDFRETLNPASKRIVQGWLEPSIAGVERETRLQFERHGYFVADRVLHEQARPVFNRITTLRDSFSK